MEQNLGYGMANINQAIYSVITLISNLLLAITVISLLITITINFKKQGFWKSLIKASLINGIANLLVVFIGCALAIYLAQSVHPSFNLLILVMLFIAPMITATILNKKFIKEPSPFGFDIATAFLVYAPLLVFIYNAIFGQTIY